MYYLIFALAFTTHEAPMFSMMSWYGKPFHGRITASGSVFDMEKLTCAHRTLPFGTVVDFYYGGRRVRAVVTDRGPFIPGREWGASRRLFYELTGGDLDKGVIEIGWIIRDVNESHHRHKQNFGCFRSQ